MSMSMKTCVRAPISLKINCVSPSVFVEWTLNPLNGDRSKNVGFRYEYEFSELVGRWGDIPSFSLLINKYLAI